MMIAKCVDCEGNMKMNDDVILGEIISCPDCGADFEVASLSGTAVTLKGAESVKEDWGE